MIPVRGLSRLRRFRYKRHMVYRLPPHIAAFCLTVYWGWVIIKLVKLARKIGKDPNAMPRERVGQWMRVLWYPCILVLLAGLWIAAARNFIAAERLPGGWSRLKQAG